MFYSIHWERIPFQKNIIKVRITFLNENGQKVSKFKYYEEWMGVCTNNIDKIVNQIKFHFPDHKVFYQALGPTKKILPYFRDRLTQGKFDYSTKCFYKVYTTAALEDVGRFFNLYKISYFHPNDWLIRIYIDLCTLYDTRSFYYMWYNVNDKFEGLMQSLEMVPDRKDSPDWTVAAFDLETVPLQGNHIPTGYDPRDRIVMISIYKWNQRHGIQKWLLYVLPPGLNEPLPNYDYGFKNEIDMLTKFHELIEDAQVLTGYNINAFDFPCIFARLVWLKVDALLQHYTSVKLGLDSVITTYKNKIVLDLYPYFKTFSNYNLPSFKLDDVARVKLKGKSKVDVKSTGIWYWYRGKYPDLYQETQVKHCFDILKPPLEMSEFGTFPMYLDYCLMDSELVYDLFEKEHVLSFLVQRANFTALNAVKALHLGNSQYLLELFKTYGTRLGYFMNSNFFADPSEYQHLIGNERTYQGALNFCIPETFCEDVSIMDFASMYPSALLSSNLCYGTCTIMTREEWSACQYQDQLTAIPYRTHSDVDFFKTPSVGKTFSYPAFHPETDEFVIVINSKAKAYLPEFVSELLKLRQYHQKLFKSTGEVFHYNFQLCVKILLNSLYGVMGTKDSSLACCIIAMIITGLSREQLLGCYYYIKEVLGFQIIYLDTDSFMVREWQVKNCDIVNTFLGLPHVELKYEQHVKRLLILSKKKYIYEMDDGTIVTKCFQKKMNGLAKFMCQKILKAAWEALTTKNNNTISDGWILWVDTLLEANYLCRDPKKYSIYRKIKKLTEYKSTGCPSVKFLKKYPDKVDEHVEMTYNRADVSFKESTNWIMSVEDCQCVNYEQLFVNQKKSLYTLLNMGFWHLKNPTESADMVLNVIHWKRFVHAELLHWHKTKGRRLMFLVIPGMKYTFTINDHLIHKNVKGPKRKMDQTESCKNLKNKKLKNKNLKIKI